MKIAVLAFPGCQTLDVVGPLEVFAEANVRIGRHVYDVEIVSDGADALPGSSGIRLMPDRTMAEPPIDVDTFLVAGSPHVESQTFSPEQLEWIRQTARKARRYGSICSGAFIMAQAGLLTGRRVTTHWSKTAALAKSFPDLSIEPDAIFVRDGAVCTSAGVTAGIDLALALVEEDFGRTAALATARELVVYLKRSGGQSQFSSQLSGQIAAIPAIESVQVWVSDHLCADLSVSSLAARCAMSPRNFSRTFLKETGVTPKDYVERVRMDAACRMISENMPLQTVAAKSGFATLANLRRTFARRLKTTPSSFRNHFGGTSSEVIAMPHA